MASAMVTERELRQLVREAEARVRVAVPLAPRWLRRAIAERMASRLAEACRSSDATRSMAAQLEAARVLGYVAPPQPPANPPHDNTLATTP